MHQRSAQVVLLVANAADRDERAKVLQVARRDNSECEFSGGRRLSESFQRLDDQVCRRRVHHLVEDSEVNRRNAFTLRVALHDLTQDVFHDFIEMVLIERVRKRLVTSLYFICHVSQLCR